MITDLDHPCDECNARPGEECRPGCTALVSALNGIEDDARGVTYDDWIPDHQAQAEREEKRNERRATCEKCGGEVMRNGPFGWTHRAVPGERPGTRRHVVVPVSDLAYRDEEKTASDAPVWFSADRAEGWAIGYNHARQVYRDAQ